MRRRGASLLKNLICHFQIFRWVRIQEILNLDEEDWFAMVDDDSDGDEEDEVEEEEMDDGEQMNL